MLAGLVGFTLLFTFLPFAGPIIWQASASCSELGTVLGGCPNVRGEVGGGAAKLDGDLTSGGGRGAGGSGAGGSGSSGSGSGASGSGGAVKGPGWVAPPMPCIEVFARYCYGVGQPKPGEPTEEAPVAGTPSVTMRDIAVFRPQPARQSMQPDGWIVVGLPTNFYAQIDRHIVAGTLLGASADVRFTPVAYRWRYGDGSSARLATKGAAWAPLGLREFDATATSHVYRASGTYVIELDVEYTAEYRFAGGSWRSLSGIIVLPANDLLATAGDAVTVLVDRDCGQAPSGPGC